MFPSQRLYISTSFGSSTINLHIKLVIESMYVKDNFTFPSLKIGTPIFLLAFISLGQIVVSFFPKMALGLKILILEKKSINLGWTQGNIVSGLFIKQ